MVIFFLWALIVKIVKVKGVPQSMGIFCIVNYYADVNKNCKKTKIIIYTISIYLQTVIII